MKVLEERTWRALRAGVAAVPRWRCVAGTGLAASSRAFRRRVSRRLRTALISRSIFVALMSGASAAFLTLPLTGCAVLHLRSQKPQAPPLQTGPGEIDREQAKQHQPPPPSTLPQPSAENTPPKLPPVKQPKVKRPRKRKPAEAPPAETQQAASSIPASPIGQLTAGDSKSAAADTRDTTALIQQTKQGLEHIKRALTPEERNTIVQIRTFLSQAEQALDNGDPDGARTLATKAKLLLDELTPK